MSIDNFSNPDDSADFDEQSETNTGKRSKARPNRVTKEDKRDFKMRPERKAKYRDWFFEEE